MEHNLTEQELALMTPQQQALAKDWNIIKRQMDWVIHEMVEVHNLMVEHDRLMDNWKRWLWFLTLLLGGGTGTGGMIYLVLKLTGR